MAKIIHITEDIYKMYTQPNQYLGAVIKNWSGVSLPMPKKNSFAIYNDDCREVMQHLPEDSIDLIVTDPPYFLDGLDNNWKKGSPDRKKKKGTVGSLPVGMKFDPRQGVQLQEFMTEITTEFMRILKPGGFAILFSNPRLSHRMANALESVAFEIRDLLAWNFTKHSQCKAFSMKHIIRKMNVDDSKKKELYEIVGERKTPQLRPQFETMILAQKPRIGTFVENFEKYRTGLVDMTQSLDGNIASTVMTVEKDKKKSYNKHLTVKPIALIEHLIKLFSSEHQIVLDPFLGSGTTIIAATKTNRRAIGIEIKPEHVKISRLRIKEHC